MGIIATYKMEFEDKELIYKNLRYFFPQIPQIASQIFYCSFEIRENLRSNLRNLREKIPAFRRTLAINKCQKKVCQIIKHSVTNLHAWFVQICDRMPIIWHTIF
jgi:hypothetical protein